MKYHVLFQANSTRVYWLIIFKFGMNITSQVVSPVIGSARMNIVTTCDTGATLAPLKVGEGAL
jgi:hypothetical protein